MRVLMVLFISWALFSCGSTSKRVAKNKNVVLSSGEFKLIAEKFSNKIADFINEKKQDNPEQSYFLALLPTKNNTLNNLPLNALEFNLVKDLLEKKIPVVRREDRQEALQELELQLAGFSENNLTIGEMKTPNFFIKMKIEENYLSERRKRLVEQTILLELRSVATQLVVLSDRVEFFKEKKTRNSIVW